MASYYVNWVIYLLIFVILIVLIALYVLLKYKNLIHIINYFLQEKKRIAKTISQDYSSILYGSDCVPDPHSNAKTAYNYEVGANKSSTTYNAKIGLPYLNEYYYAAAPTYWTYRG